VNFNDLLPPFDQRGMDLSLARMNRALKQLGSPTESIPAVQVVGTNGKGSIATLIHSALTAAGIHSGLTTSPHLIDWCERIRVDGQTIRPETLRQRLIELQPLARQENLTPFELLITAALIHFQAESVQWLVLEAGLGGRLDATTAHPNRPLVAVASIGLDHCEHLGGTLTAVAGEKAAVIQAQLIQVSPLGADWQLGLDGIWQRDNGAVALEVLQQIAARGWPVDAASIRHGFAAARWPGRLQPLLWRQRQVLVDGAHNPPAAERLAGERAHWSGQSLGLNWILGIQSHKEAPAMLRSLLQPQDRAWIVPVNGHRSWSAEALKASCPELATQLREADGREPVETALEQLEQAGWPQARPVIAGSLYLLGDLLGRGLLRAE
jgi:dihydrofolate synthase/folylpolyglutamate synthase